MICDEHCDGYIKSLIPDLDGYLEGIEEEAINNRVPIIRKDMQQFLKVMLELHKPEYLLEIGSATGFSSIYMAYCQKSLNIVTIEKDGQRALEAEKNIENSDAFQRIRLIHADACEALVNLGMEKKQFDMVFMDAAKGQYGKFLELILKNNLLRKGGLLITDNILQEGSVAWSKFTIERRNRTIHMRMRDYVFMLTHDDRFETSVISTGDGAALTVIK